MILFKFNKTLISSDKTSGCLDDQLEKPPEGLRPLLALKTLHVKCPISTYEGSAFFCKVVLVQIWFCYLNDFSLHSACSEIKLCLIKSSTVNMEPCIVGCMKFLLGPPKGFTQL